MWAATWDAIRLLHFRALHLLCRFVGLPLSADFEAAGSRGCCDRFSVDERVLCEAGVRAVVGCTLVLPKWAPCLSFGLSLILLSFRPRLRCKFLFGRFFAFPTHWEGRFLNFSRAGCKALLGLLDGVRFKIFGFAGGPGGTFCTFSAVHCLLYRPGGSASRGLP